MQISLLGSKKEEMKQLTRKDFSITYVGEVSHYSFHLGGYELCLEVCLDGFCVGLYDPNKGLVVPKECIRSDHQYDIFGQAEKTEQDWDKALKIANRLYYLMYLLREEQKQRPRVIFDSIKMKWNDSTPPDPDNDRLIIREGYRTLLDWDLKSMPILKQGDTMNMPFPQLIRIYSNTYIVDKPKNLDVTLIGIKPLDNGIQAFIASFPAGSTVSVG